MICTDKEAQSIIPELPYYFDEPFADSSAIPTILVSSFAKKHVTVSLSADGGDELFGGYGRYFADKTSINTLVNLPFPVKKMLKPFADIVRYIPFVSNADLKSERLNRLFSEKNRAKYLLEPNLFETRSLNNLIKKPFQTPMGFFNDIKSFNENNDLVNELMAVDYKTYMVDDILTKVDRATMSVGLEGREPFLDHRLLEYLASLPSNLKTSSASPKKLLRSIVHKYIPKEIMDRPKKGFGIPLSSWFKGPLKYQFDEIFNLDKIDKDGLFETSAISVLLNKYYRGDKIVSDYSFTKLWYIFCFISWQRKWL